MSNKERFAETLKKSDEIILRTSLNLEAIHLKAAEQTDANVVRKAEPGEAYTDPYNSYAYVVPESDVVLGITVHAESNYWPTYNNLKATER